MIDNIYALKDVVHSDPFSKTNNFIYEWIKWFPYIKLAPKEYQFKNTDIIIVNLDDALNPFVGYEINKKCKKIYIVHRINKPNLTYLSDAFFIIYMNPVIAQICEVNNVKAPSHIAKRFPLLNVPNTEVNTFDTAYFVGKYEDMYKTELSDYIMRMHSELPKSTSFYFGFIWENTDSNLKSLADVLLNISKKVNNTRQLTFVQNQDELIIAQFKMRTSKYGCIYSVQPDIKGFDYKTPIENIDIDESSMMAMLQSYNLKICCDNKINFVSYANDVTNYTYKEFSLEIAEILKIYLPASL